jgi:hypothetical protein
VVFRRSAGAEYLGASGEDASLDIVNHLVAIDVMDLAQVLEDLVYYLLLGFPDGNVFAVHSSRADGPGHKVVAACVHLRHDNLLLQCWRGAHYRGALNLAKLRDNYTTFLPL